MDDAAGEHDEPFADRWVRVMADAECEGIWERSGCPGELDRLPITPALSGRVLAWQRRFDREADEDTFDVKGFAKDGLAIAVAIKGELPDWTVVYLDEARLRLKPKGKPFEYEIEAGPPA